jgi:hypothetical protein
MLRAAPAGDHEFTVLRKPFDLSDLSRATAKAVAGLRSDGPGNVIRLHGRRAVPEQHRVRQDPSNDPSNEPGDVPA